MGLFDFLFRSRKGGPSPAPAADELRQLLLDAVARGDVGALEHLCTAHRQAIAEHFPSWRKVPAGVLGRRDAEQSYIGGLVVVARFFAERLGRPELLQCLMGPPESNPVVRWQQQMEQARALMNELRFREAAQRLTDALIDVRGQHGSAVDAYLPVSYGMLGECYFQGGEADKAVAPCERALQLCRASGDAQGVAAYLGNLYEVHRYLGQAGPAADYAERLAEALQGQGRAEEAERYRRQAARVRAGEPLNRVIAGIDGKRYELEEVPAGVQGRVQFFFERNRLTLRPATVLNERGEREAGQGRFEEALGHFREAAAADRFDPHPHYQAGLTLLYLQRYPQAVESYEAAEERAPGWFHCRADLWLARQMVLDRVSHEVFLGWHALQDGPQPPQAKVRLAEQVLSRAPELALLHLLHGKNLRVCGQEGAAESAYRRGLACAEEPDVRSRLLLELATLVQEPGEKRGLLQEAHNPEGNLIAAATARLMLRAIGLKQ
jgi:tetratricopeptide (TPR) repeat protein